jgi:hypothetical protein
VAFLFEVKFFGSVTYFSGGVISLVFPSFFDEWALIWEQIA